MIVVRVFVFSSGSRVCYICKYQRPNVDAYEVLRVRPKWLSSTTQRAKTRIGRHAQAPLSEGG